MSPSQVPYPKHPSHSHLEGLGVSPARKPGERRTWQHLQGAAQALALVTAARAHPGITLILSASAKSAATLANECVFFRGETEAEAENLPIVQFPDWETLPYDLFSPHEDIISERLATLYRLPRLERGIVIVPVTTAMHRLAPPAFIAGNSFVYRTGDTVDISALGGIPDRAAVQWQGFFRC